MTFYVSIIYELGGCSFYVLLLPPLGLLHHLAISLMLSPPLSHIVPRVLIFPPLSRHRDKSGELMSLVCVFLGPTHIHLTDGFYRTPNPEQLDVKNCTCPFWPNCNSSSKHQKQERIMICSASFPLNKKDARRRFGWHSLIWWLSAVASSVFCTAEVHLVVIRSDWHFWE